MRSTASKAVAKHRARLKQRGLVRVEVRAPKEDAPLLRDVAEALADPARGPQARLWLRRHFNPYAGMNFKELLAAAPLDDIDLERNPDTGRPVDL